MKRFLILLSLLFCNMVFADTINLHWKNYDGTSYQDSTCVVDSDLILPSTPPTRYGYTFTGWKISNYIPIEYLESTGTQYIDTGVEVDQSISLEMKGIQGGGDCALFGVADGFYAFDNSSQTIYTAFCGSAYGPLTAEMRTTPHIIKMGKEEGLVVDNVKITDFENPTSYTYRSMFLFARRAGNGSVQKLGNHRIYYVKIYDNNNLVRDFVPALDYNGIPCMYDKVEDKFYYNQGTGQFTAGPIL